GPLDPGRALRGHVASAPLLAVEGDTVLDDRHFERSWIDARCQGLELEIRAVVVEVDQRILSGRATWQERKAGGTDAEPARGPVELLAKPLEFTDGIPRCHGRPPSSPCPTGRCSW